MVITDKVKTALGGILVGIQTFVAKVKNGEKRTQILPRIVLILAIATAVFFSLKWYASSRKVFASTAALKVELPSGIKSKDLQNLNEEQKKKLSEKIKNALSEKPKETALQGFVIPQVIIFTENNQPVFLENQTLSTPTSTPTPTTTQLEPTTTPTPSATPTLTPTPTPSGPLKIEAEDLVDWAPPWTSGWSKSCGTGFCMIDSTPKDRKSTFNFTYTCPMSHKLKAVVQKGPNRGSFLVRSTNPATAATINLQQSGEYILPEVDLLTNLASGFQQVTITANGDGYTSIDKFILPSGCTRASQPTPLTIEAEDLVDWAPPWTSGWSKSCGTGFCMIDSTPKDRKSTFTFSYSCPSSHNLEAVVQKGPNRGSFKIQSTNPARTANINLVSQGEYTMNTINPLIGLASGSQLITITANGDGYTSIDKFILPFDCVKTEAASGAGEINFTISQEAKDAYYNENSYSLVDDVDKIYQKAKEIFGPPYKNISVSVEIGNDGRYYNATLNKIVFEKNDPPSRLQLIWMILSAFHDDLVVFMPEIWEKGIIETVLYEINSALFEPNQSYIGSQTSTYELLNSPAVSNNNGALSQGEVTGLLSTHNLTLTAWRKPYYEDKNFFVNLNKTIYQQQVIDNTLKDKLISIAAGVKGSIEGMTASEWFANQHILRFNAQVGKWIILVVQKAANETSDVLVHLQALEVFGNGNKTGKNNLDVQVKAFDFDGNQVWSSTAKTARIDSYDGVVSLGSLPAASNGCLRFTIGVVGFGSTEFYYPYKNGQPMAPGDATADGIYGCVDQKDGKVLAKTGAGEQSVDLVGGAFSLPNLKDYQGAVELTFTPSTGSQTKKKAITKLAVDYYTFIKTGAPPVSRSGSRESTSSCVDGWQDYENEDFKLKFKIPSDWTDDSIDERQTDSLLDRLLISTTTPEEQLDPQKKISTFRIIASKNDLKTDENYQGLFENYAEGAKQSQTDFKGVSAEKVVANIALPAGDFHSEQYYFKNGEVYYYLKLGTYTTPDLKEKNEGILKCFLDNFELPDQEETVGGMKLFTSQKLQFKIYYPAELFVYEWKSSYQPDFNKEKPDWDRNIVQFFKNKDLKGGKITIRRDTNSQRKTAIDFAKAYWSASEKNLKHWKPGNIDFVIHSVKVQGSSEEEKTYLTPLGDWMYIFDSSETGSFQSALENMLPTLEFLGSGEDLSKDLIPCPDDLFSTAEQLKEQQENWWEKPDPCDSRPEQKTCGYIRSIYDNGVIEIHNSDYRNLYCYCSFFEKNGSRIYRGTEMFSLGYKEGACKEKI